MRAILAAAVLLAACGDNREPTLGDYAAELGDALRDTAVACGEASPERKWRYDIDVANAEKFADRFCALRDSNAEFTDCAEPFEFDMDACLDALDAIGCVNVGMPENCPNCGFAGLPAECRAMWDATFHG